ncbi:GIY-YIG nuclease family protein [Rhodopseudomonas sp. BR0M22]|uniref:GIY-YIG nuclease family protein n=1 Tax=Rhodopseudomonas sp. BR0M22 TaxID=2269369 RepID=UPI0013DEB70E|nr:GIY-YIG nuclease family protein [Rhodopseudomonas sp. BR0M22]NEW91798.1 GIY-YIG nuclease family protein [Rhodopseudomonas sp. BR0M22]
MTSAPHPACPSGPGAYVVAIAIAAPLAIRLGAAASPLLRPGRYLYCGSAYGPGGLPARLGRHFRKDKAIRWHVDQLTTAGEVLGAWAIAGGDECELVARLGFLPVPIEGFGATDCAHCRSHLLRWPSRVAARTVRAALAGDDAAPVWLRGDSTPRSRA